VPKQLATWNTARDAWEKPDTEGLTCGHSAVYSATFPTSGSMRNGAVFELPKWEPATSDTGSSSLLKTPTSQLATNGGSQHPDKRKAGGHGPTLADEIEHLLPKPTERDTSAGGPKLLPTPVAQHSGNSPEGHLRKKPGREVVTDLAILTENGLLETGGRLKLLRTPCASEAEGGPRNPDRPGATMRLSDQIREELTGASMPQQSAAGKGQSADQLPGQLSLLDELEQSA
jgi:hypothetical protein